MKLKNPNKFRNRKVSFTTFVFTVALILSLSLGAIQYIVAQTTEYIASPFGFVKTASYIILKSGGTYYAVNGRTGTDLSTSTSANTVAQAAVNALASGGGKIFFTSSSYPNIELTIPANFYGVLVLEGEANGFLSERGTWLTSNANAPMIKSLRTSRTVAELHIRHMAFKHTSSTSGIATLDLMYVDVYLEDVFVKGAGSQTTGGTGIKAGPSAGASTVIWQDVHSEEFDVPFDLSVDHLTGIGLTAAGAKTAGFYVHNCYALTLIEPHTWETDDNAVSFLFDYIYVTGTVINPWQEVSNAPMFKYVNPGTGIKIIGGFKDGTAGWFVPTYGKGLCFDYYSDHGAAATIPSGQTTVQVNHKMWSDNPTTEYVIQLTPTSNTAGKQWWVSTKGGNYFIISIDSSHTSDISFDWTIEKAVGQGI